MKGKNFGVLEMIITTAIWGSIPILAIFSDLPSPVFVFFRVFITSIFLIPVIRKRVNLRNLINKYVFLSGIFLALNWILLFYAVSIIQVSEAILLYYSGPIFAILIMHFLGERIGINRYISIIIAFTGIFIIINPTTLNISIGALIALASGIFYGLLAVASKMATGIVNSKELVFYQTIISTIITSPFLLILRFNLTLNNIVIVTIAALVNTLLALFLWYDALTKISVQLSSILSYLDPVFAMLFAFIFLHQIPTLISLLGGILIIISGIFSVIIETRNIKR
ncbi:permease [Acidianus hospitalis]|uniref:Permease n=1 Tax=Acidianus hospitalis TaxID=563177 RepID=A0A2T9X283_9CREN|nr:permease [Acidianus hospitalis]